MGFIYLAGRHANAIEGAETITVSSENAEFPKENAYDRFPGKPFKFNAAAAEALKTGHRALLMIGRTIVTAQGRYRKRAYFKGRVTMR
jgi:hypothetical protein